MYFDVDEKVSLFYRVWEPEDKNIKGRVVIVHGYAEHSGRYEKAGRYLADAGFKVYAPDLPGHGKSSGKKGLAEDVVLVSEYIKNFIDFIVNGDERSKLFLIGHSMGGGISLIYAASFGSSIDGLITSGAAVYPLPYPPAPIRKILSSVANYFPYFKTMELGAEKISTLKDVVADYKKDPLNYNGKVMAGTAVQLFRIRKIVEANVSKITEPLFLLHGSEDSLASPSGSTKVYDSASSEDKKIKIYEGCRHEILNDFRQDEVLADIREWLLERV